MEADGRPCRADVCLFVLRSGISPLELAAAGNGSVRDRPAGSDCSNDSRSNCEQTRELFKGALGRVCVETLARRASVIHIVDVVSLVVAFLVSSRFAVTAVR
jgi:hypothetical protein